MKSGLLLWIFSTKFAHISLGRTFSSLKVYFYYFVLERYMKPKNPRLSSVQKPKKKLFIRIKFFTRWMLNVYLIFESWLAGSSPSDQGREFMRLDPNSSDMMTQLFSNSWSLATDTKACFTRSSTVGAFDHKGVLASISQSFSGVLRFSLQ